MDEGAADSARERGLALLVVLWIIVSAAILVSAFNVTAKSGASFVISEIEQAKVEAALDAGAEIAAAHLIDSEEARRWPADGSRRKVSFGGSDLTITILDANGLIDLNKTDGKILLGFLRQFAGSETKAAQLRDAILSAREDVAPRKGKGGMEDSMGGEMEGSIEQIPQGIAFVDAAQIRGLNGMTPDVYRQIAPFLTVYGHTGRINPMTAPSEVLAAIPKLTKGDVETLRDALKTKQESNSAALADVMQRAGSHLTDQRGPAYYVSVEARRSNEAYRARKLYVIAIGLDQVAPYRLIARMPITLTNG